MTSQRPAPAVAFPGAEAPCLAGTGRLADDLFLLAHDDATGRPFLAGRALALGLGGALLGELALARAIRLRENRVTATGWTPAADWLAGAVLGRVLAEAGPQCLPDWLAVIGRTARHDVARRLAEAGYLAPRSGWRARRAGRWVPVDSNCAFAAVIRVRAALDPARHAAVGDVTLTGLACASGLGSRLLPYGPPGARRHLEQQIRRLPPVLRELVTQTQAAVDAAVLSHRV